MLRHRPNLPRGVVCPKDTPHHSIPSGTLTRSSVEANDTGQAGCVWTARMGQGDGNVRRASTQSPRSTTPARGRIDHRLHLGRREYARGSTTPGGPATQSRETERDKTMIRHWRSARGEGGGWLYSPAVPAFFFPGGYCCQPRRTDVIITTGNGAVTPYLRTTQTWNGAAWTTRTDIPLPGRFSAAGAYVNGLFHVTGGVGPAPLDSHHQWNPATDTWTTQTPVPLPRRSEHTALELNGSLFLWGGRASSNTLLNTTNEYRLGTWITGMPLPGPARTGARALPLQGRGYLFTGETALGVYTTRVDCYDPLTQTWTSKQPMTPPGRQGCGGFTFNNTCVVHGGGKPVSSRAERYFPMNDVWVGMSQLPAPARQNSVSQTTIGNVGTAAASGEDGLFTRLPHHTGFQQQTWLTLGDLPLEARKLATGG
jgi:hypothetical protein